MTEHRCQWPVEPCELCATISAHQRALPREEDLRPGSPSHYRRKACWWTLEAARGYRSAPRCRVYARVQRLLAELATEHGDGTMAELLARSGYKIPDFDAMEAEERRGMPTAGCGAP